MPEKCKAYLTFLAAKLPKTSLIYGYNMKTVKSLMTYRGESIMIDASELRNALAYCTGTEKWYRHSLVRNFVYTDGIKTFIENAGGGAYWFTDIVATEFMPLQAKEPFISIALKVKDSDATIEVTDGNENTLATRHVGFTDCPDGTWNFYLIDKVMLLPSEY